MDIGESMVWWLASSAPHREAADGLEVAPTGLKGLLDEAVTSLSETWSPPASTGASGPHPAHGRGKLAMGSKANPSRVGEIGFKVSARTVAKYMRPHRNRGPSPGWRKFLKQHAPNIWACDFFCVHTILFQTLYVFFVKSASSKLAGSTCANNGPNGLSRVC